MPRLLRRRLGGMHSLHVRRADRRSKLAAYALANFLAALSSLAFGLFNGIGVAFLRIPSTTFTLGVNAVAQGLMVLHTSRPRPGLIPCREAEPQVGGGP
jgi:ribose/xylose/arabinose/galactoside ABC-type transport system permease subunit